MKTLEEQLTEVQQAISDILLNAQEAWYNGQKVRKADLVTLERREKRLLVQIKRKNRGGIRVRGATPV
ncbi:MAG: hypothetical protein KGP29_07450 [Proteobacteria bacterium]|nr:hypothetical protein [Pseudomonadota bacterium]